MASARGQVLCVLAASAQLPRACGRRWRCRWWCWWSVLVQVLGCRWQSCREVEKLVAERMLAKDPSKVIVACALAACCDILVFGPSSYEDAYRRKQLHDRRHASAGEARPSTALHFDRPLRLHCLLLTVRRDFTAFC